MKKLLFTLLFGMILTSCGGSSEANTEATDCACDSTCTCESPCACTVDTTDVVVVDTVAVDTIL